MRRSKSNPWLEDEQVAEHGRAVIHVSPDAGPIRFSKSYLVSLVAKRVRAGSITFQVGLWQGDQERSAQVVLVNGGFAVMPWRTFAQLAEVIAADLCVSLAQQGVLLELFSASGGYRARGFAQLEKDWQAQRRRLVAGRERGRGRPR